MSHCAYAIFHRSYYNEEAIASSCLNVATALARKTKLDF